MTLVVLFALTKVPLNYFLLPLMCFTLLAGVLAARLPYVTTRLKVYLNPQLDLKGKGHQPYQAKIAAGSGQLGKGTSWKTLKPLPKRKTIYIAAIYAEEFGFVGVLSLITLYMSLALVGFAISLLSPRDDGYYLAASITFLISFQAFLNMGVVSLCSPVRDSTCPYLARVAHRSSPISWGSVCSVALKQKLRY